ncbi:hypothetical protein NDU88_002526 [Pleurodeles waltl]|uniref:Uncharacterized protein n=1 Tax=Pleurodeles waltl TaxID=8319 RepID=A0AAV7VD34_PLEWA|nr:hypothetical protein NDU88_002526 [Pleurodeles waltl]
MLPVRGLRPSDSHPKGRRATSPGPRRPCRAAGPHCTGFGRSLLCFRRLSHRWADPGTAFVSSARPRVASDTSYTSRCLQYSDGSNPSFCGWVVSGLCRVRQRTVLRGPRGSSPKRVSRHAMPPVAPRSDGVLGATVTVWLRLGVR